MVVNAISMSISPKLLFDRITVSAQSSTWYGSRTEMPRSGEQTAVCLIRMYLIEKVIFRSELSIRYPHYCCTWYVIAFARSGTTYGHVLAAFLSGSPHLVGRQQV